MSIVKRIIHRGGAIPVRLGAVAGTTAPSTEQLLAQLASAAGLPPNTPADAVIAAVQAMVNQLETTKKKRDPLPGVPADPRPVPMVTHAPSAEQVLAQRRPVTESDVSAAATRVRAAHERAVEARESGTHESYVFMRQQLGRARVELRQNVAVFRAAISSGADRARWLGQAVRWKKHTVTLSDGVIDAEDKAAMSAARDFAADQADKAATAEKVQKSLAALDKKITALCLELQQLTPGFNIGKAIKTAETLREQVLIRADETAAARAQDLPPLDELEPYLFNPALSDALISAIQGGDPMAVRTAVEALGLLVPTTTDGAAAAKAAASTTLTTRERALCKELNVDPVKYLAGKRAREERR